MSGLGRKASQPPAGHSRPEPLSLDGLVVHHYNKHGRVLDFDFSTLPVAAPMQRSLAAVFAARCRRWSAHATSKGNFGDVRRFAEFLSQTDRPPRDLDELTAVTVKTWRVSKISTPGGYKNVATIAVLLRSDPRLLTGRVADELARRQRKPKSNTQSYSGAQFDQIVVTARRMFRAAHLRITENSDHLERWRRGEFAEGSQDWVIGEGLDILARTGDLPRHTSRTGRRPLAKQYRRAFGGTTAARTTLRLFLSRMEAAALAVLLMAEYGWNLSVIDHAEVPRAAPDQGEDGHPTYRIPLEKPRRRPGHQFETRNVTDDGASSAGRLITQALEATRFARAVVEDLAPGTDLLMVWWIISPGQAKRTDQDRQPPIGPFGFGVDHASAAEWAYKMGLGRSSPFRRGRHTVNALDRREPGQNSQDTHDRNYVLPDQRVQAQAVEVIAAGAEGAADRAREAVLIAEIRDEPVAGDVETATADCSDYENGPYPSPDGGCGVPSFLDCLGCPNARIHPGLHGRLALLHASLSNLRSALPPNNWALDWGQGHDRLEDLKKELGDGQWTRALTRVTDTDRELIDALLTGDLNT